jgi:hypothetical protein
VRHTCSRGRCGTERRLSRSQRAAVLEVAAEAMTSLREGLPADLLSGATRHALAGLKDEELDSSGSGQAPVSVV